MIVTHHPCAIIAATLVAACTTALPTPSTDQEKNDAIKAWFVCLHAQARKMDDGRSDAASIALAIAPLCYAEFKNSLNVEAKGMNPQVQRILEDRVQGKQIEYATAAVLDERKAREGR